jgi:uncharacterized protein (DUF927 family)
MNSAISDQVNQKSSRSYANRTDLTKVTDAPVGVTPPIKSIIRPESAPSAPWSGIPLPPGYLLNWDGLFKISDDGRPQGLISKPIWLEALTCDAHTNQYGMVICWIDLQEKKQREPFDRGLLHDRGGALIRTLFKRGLSITSGKERELINYLNNSTSGNKNVITSVSRLGWLNLSVDSDVLAYILPPEKVIGGQLTERVIFKAETHSPTINTIKTKGTLEQWQRNVVEPCKNNPYLVFSLCTALTAPLLKLANMESGGFHLYGHSSRGKTTAAQVPASVFGCGADPAENSEHSYIQRWNATGNAFEALASAHNDGLLVLDELHSCESKEFGRIVYNLFGGKGKGRLNENAELRQSRVWTFLVLSTGEISAQKHIEESGKKVYAGMKVRLMDIPIGDNNIVQDDKGKGSAEFVISLKKACSRYYGVAAPAYIEWLIETLGGFNSARHLIQCRHTELTRKLAGNNSQPEHERAIRRLALVQLAGELGVESGVLTLDKEDIEHAVMAIKSAWSNDDTNKPDYIQGALKVRDFIHKHPAKFMSTHDSSSLPPRDLAGYRDGTSFMFSPQGFVEACGSYDAMLVAKHLAEMGYLQKECGRLQKKVSICGVGRPRLYVLKREFIEYEFT